MSLYDDLDTKQIPDWSSGISKLLPQPQLNLKNKIQPPKKQVKVLENYFRSVESNPSSALAFSTHRESQAESRR